MIAMSLRALMIKVLVFFLSNLLYIKDSVDTQQINIPYINYTLYVNLLNK